MAKEIEPDVDESELSDGDLEVEGDLDELSEDELLDEDGIEDDDDLEDGSLVDEVPDDVEVLPLVEGADGTPAAAPRASEEEASTEEEDDEEPDDDDVEASLDVILKERLVVEDEEQEDEDEAVEVDDRGDGSTRVLPKQPGEFVCRSCFLVKSETQLADKRKSLCRDCV